MYKCKQKKVNNNGHTPKNEHFNINEVDSEKNVFILQKCMTFYIMKQEKILEIIPGCLWGTTESDSNGLLDPTLLTATILNAYLAPVFRSFTCEKNN